MAGKEPVTASVVRGTGSGRTSLILSLICSVISWVGAAASSTRYRSGSARASTRNPARTRRWNSSGSASIRSAERACRLRPISGGMSSSTVRSGVRPSVAQLFSRAISAVGMPRPAPW